MPALDGPAPDRKGNLELSIARLLTVGTYVSVSLLAVGLAAMLVTGISPYAEAPILDPGRLLGDLLAGRADSFLWLGLVAAIATPTARVMAALVGFARAAEWEMAAVSAAILGVITLGVVLALVAGA